MGGACIAAKLRHASGARNTPRINKRRHPASPGRGLDNPPKMPLTPRILLLVRIRKPAAMPMRIPPPSEVQGVKCCQSMLMIKPFCGAIAQSVDGRNGKGEYLTPSLLYRKERYAVPERNIVRLIQPVNVEDQLTGIQRALAAAPSACRFRERKVFS